jgi:hypothetical protein
MQSKSQYTGQTITKFADWTDEEFKALLGTKLMDTSKI